VEWWSGGWPPLPPDHAPSSGGGASPLPWPCHKNPGPCAGVDAAKAPGTPAAASSCPVAPQSALCVAAWALGWQCRPAVAATLTWFGRGACRFLQKHHGKSAWRRKFCSHAVTDAMARCYRKSRRGIKKNHPPSFPLSTPRSLAYNIATGRTPNLAPSP
jgi:hypothetical protein